MDKINVTLSKNNINLVKMTVSEIYNIVFKDCIYNIDEYKWSGMAKNNFVNSLKKLTDELMDYLNLLDRSNESMNQVSVAQNYTLEIRKLQQENIILRTSTKLEDKSKIIKNEQEIKKLEEKIKNIENLLIQSWR